jgi:hypothetical protein
MFEYLSGDAAAHIKSLPSPENTSFAKITHIHNYWKILECYKAREVNACLPLGSGAEVFSLLLSEGPRAFSRCGKF